MLYEAGITHSLYNPIVLHLVGVKVRGTSVTRFIYLHYFFHRLMYVARPERATAAVIRVVILTVACNGVNASQVIG